MAIKTKIGTANADTLTGTTGIDWLYGLDGNDVLRGDKGNDLLAGGIGNDTLEGGIGADVLNGGAGNDTFLYKNFNDIKRDPLNLTEEINDFSTGDKIDFSAITASARHFIGNEEFNGVAGEIRYEYNNTNYQSIMNLLVDVDGDAVADSELIINYSRINKKSINLVETSTNSGVLILATNQTKTGDANANTLTGGAGNDTLLGLAGNDSLNGSSGDDSLNGGDGNDSLIGGLGADAFTGGTGNDLFQFVRPEDIAEGNTLSNGIFYSDYDYYNSKNGIDKITDFGNGDQIGFNTMAGVALDYIGNAPFSAVVGQYRFAQGYYGRNGSNNSDGQIQFDFDGDTQTDAIIRVNDFSSLGGLGESPTVANRLVFVTNQTINGTTANNTLNGGVGSDTLSGLSGNDTLSGLDGNDSLIGSFGADTLTGGTGNDIFQFNSMAELGYYSRDEYYYRYNKIYDQITDFRSGDQIVFSISGVTLKYIGTADFNDVAGEYRFDSNQHEIQFDFDGSGYQDATITLNDFSALGGIKENSTNHLIFVANQTLNGTLGNDTLNGDIGNDTLSGLAGNDTLNGLDGNDNLDGGDGNDLLVGGFGRDTMTGGVGNDVFKFSSLNDFYNSYTDEIITDFSAGDKIDLSGIDANSNIAGDQVFNFINTSSFTDMSGQLRFSYDTVYGDVNGDGDYDFQIQLNNSYNRILNATDFIL